MSHTAIVVDDSLSVRLLTAKMLGELRPDWTIIAASDGEDALAKADGLTLDLMILDINMPGIDGFELAEKLRPASPNAWITLLSANVQEKVQTRARERDLGFIEKPVSIEKLEALLHDFEESRHD